MGSKIIPSLLPTKTFQAATQVWGIFLPKTMQAGIKWHNIFTVTGGGINLSTYNSILSKNTFQKKEGVSTLFQICKSWKNSTPAGLQSKKCFFKKILRQKENYTRRKSWRRTQKTTRNGSCTGNYKIYCLTFLKPP